MKTQNCPLVGGTAKDLSLGPSRSPYALMGRYDFVTIIEAPDDETLAHLVVDLGA